MNNNFPLNGSKSKTCMDSAHVLNTFRNQKIRDELAELRKLNENLIKSSNEANCVCQKGPRLDDKSEPISPLVFFKKQFVFFFEFFLFLIFIYPSEMKRPSNKPNLSSTKSRLVHIPKVLNIVNF